VSRNRAAGGSLRQDLAGLPRVVWVLSAGSFVNNFGNFVVPFLVLYLIHQGYSAAQAAGAVSAYAAGKIAAGPLGGQLADRLGPRVTVVGSMAGSAVATAALAAVHGLGVIVAVAALTGLLAESYRPAVSALMTAAAPGPQRVQGFGVYQLGVNAGAAAGPAIGGVLAEHSYLVLFACDAATSLIWACLAWRTLPGITPGRDPAPARLPDAGGGLLRDRRLLRLLAVTVLINLILFQAQTTLPLWVHRQGLPTSTYGLLLAVSSGLIVALQLPAARLTRRWRPQPVMAVTSVVAGAGFALLAVAHTVPLLLLAVGVWSLGELAHWPVAAAYTTSLAPPGRTGRYAGARSVCFGTALLVAPLAGTALYHLSPGVLWGACAAAGACAAVIISSRPRRAAPWPGARFGRGRWRTRPPASGPAAPRRGEVSTARVRQAVRTG
jgi:MFS family permease